MRCADDEELKEKILRLKGGDGNLLPQTREIGVLLVDMLDDEEIFERLDDAVNSGDIARLEEVVMAIMEEEGLDKDSFELPKDSMSLQVPLDEDRVERLNFLHDLLFRAGGGTKIADTMFLFLSDSPKTLVQLQLVCKTWRDKLSSDRFWKPLAISKWPFLGQHGDAKAVKNWRGLVAARTLRLEQAMKAPLLTELPAVVPIENCHRGLTVVETKLPKSFKWELKCPVALSNLKQTFNPKIDFCKLCKKNVYLCENEDELKSHVTKGHCVALDLDSKIFNARKTPRRRPRPPGALLGWFSGRLRGKIAPTSR